MNKLILLLPLALFGCATDQPTRTVLNCDQQYVVSSKVPFVGGSQKRGGMTCDYVQIPVAPQAEPLQAPAELVN